MSVALAFFLLLQASPPERATSKPLHRVGPSAANAATMTCPPGRTEARTCST